MKTQLLLLCLAGICSLCQCTNSTGSSHSDATNTLIQGATGARMDSLFTPYLEQLRVATDNEAAIAVGITQGEEIVYARSFGLANVAQDIPADLHTLFHVASLSKPFTSLAIATLVEKGALRFDDRLVDIVPEFEMADSNDQEITIRHLLSHSAGVPRHVATDDWLKPSFGPQAVSENLEHARSFALDFKPSSQYSYSNAGFDLLGVVIERVSGQPFAEYLEQAVLRPAGMRTSTFVHEGNSLPSNWAEAYSYGVQTQVWEPFPYSERVLPSSGLKASILDLCQWGLLHVKNGEAPTGRLLKAETMNEIVSPQIATPWGDQMGLGWFLQSYLDRPIIMHTGADTGFEAMIYIYPEEDVSIVVLANRDFARTGRLINAASEILFGQSPKEYQVSARFPFAKTFQRDGMEAARKHWQILEADTTDIYQADSDDLLTAGAVLENGKYWSAANEMLTFYLESNPESTYAWRLLGNTYLGMSDTLQAIDCYRQTLAINPDYEKGQKALLQLESRGN
ncbi:MAG: serine hydrolase [Bacteroidota bacterium]